MSKKEQFGERLIEACRQVNEQIKSEDPFGPMDAEGWYEWKGDTMIRPAGRVEVVHRNGSSGSVSAHCAQWGHHQTSGDIVKWRPAQ